MPTTNGIPSISDYAHWNEDAEYMWYEENKYDMMHPEVFEEYLDDQFYNDERYYDEEIPEERCWELNRHSQNTSGYNILFGPNADILADTSLICDDCGMDLTSDWTPEGYKVTYDWTAVLHENVTAAGRRLVGWWAEGKFPVFERITNA
jgi:hypothetical protein